MIKAITKLNLSNLRTLILTLLQAQSRALLLIAGLFFIAPVVSANELAVQAGWLFDSETGKLLEKRTVHVVDGRIESVEPGFSQRENEKLVNLHDYTVLPGLMDMHTHLAYEYGPRTYMETFTWNPADYTLRGVNTAKRTLLAGFTTVRDLGDANNITISLRKAINRGDIQEFSAKLRGAHKTAVKS